MFFVLFDCFDLSQRSLRTQLIGVANIWTVSRLLKRWRTREEPTDTSLLDQLSSSSPPREHSRRDASLTDTGAIDVVGDARSDAHEATRAANDASATTGGCFAACCPRLLRIVDRPEKMYIVGFVFGLGFETGEMLLLVVLYIYIFAVVSFVFYILFFFNLFII